MALRTTQATQITRSIQTRAMMHTGTFCFATALLLSLATQSMSRQRIAGLSLGIDACEPEGSEFRQRFESRPNISMSSVTTYTAGSIKFNDGCYKSRQRKTSTVGMGGHYTPATATPLSSPFTVTVQPHLKQPRGRTGRSTTTWRNQALAGAAPRADQAGDCSGDPVSGRCTAIRRPACGSTQPAKVPLSATAAPKPGRGSCAVQLLYGGVRKS